MSSNWLGNYENPQRPVYHPPAVIDTPMPPMALQSLNERPELQKPAAPPAARPQPQMDPGSKLFGQHMIRQLMEQRMQNQRFSARGSMPMKTPTPAPAPNGIGKPAAQPELKSVLRPN